jgi:hypothetical protein
MIDINTKITDIESESKLLKTFFEDAIGELKEIHNS